MTKPSRGCGYTSIASCPSCTRSVGAGCARSAKLGAGWIDSASEGRREKGTVNFSPNAADNTRTTAVTVRRSAIRTRRQDRRGASPFPRTPPEREPPGSKGAKPPLVSLQCYILGRLAHVTGYCVKFDVVRTEASPVPSHGLSHLSGYTRRMVPSWPDSTDADPLRKGRVNSGRKRTGRDHGITCPTIAS